LHDHRNAVIKGFIVIRIDNLSVNRTAIREYRAFPSRPEDSSEDFHGFRTTYAHDTNA
jgi:hypothetical protein